MFAKKSFQQKLPQQQAAATGGFYTVGHTKPWLPEKALQFNNGLLGKYHFSLPFQNLQNL